MCKAQKKMTLSSIYVFQVYLIAGNLRDRSGLDNTRSRKTILRFIQKKKQLVGYWET